MGYSTLIDILGAMIIGGLLFLISMSAMDSGLERFVNQNADAIVQNQIAEMSDIVQYDLRKMGYGVPEASIPNVIQVGTSNRLKFLTHLNRENPFEGVGGTDNVADTIEYQVIASDTISFIDTSIYLYRVNRTVSVSGHAVESRMIGKVASPAVFRYLDQVGNPVGSIAGTKMIEVSLMALNPDIYLNEAVIAAAGPTERMRELRRLLRESYWRQTRVVSKNLRR